MALRIKADGSQVRIQFVLPDDIHDGQVSAVGSFNDWKPGAHQLVRRSNGTRSVTVAVPAGQPIEFRYLGEGGVWFDDDDAHAITADGSLVRAWTFSEESSQQGCPNVSDWVPADPVDSSSVPRVAIPHPTPPGLDGSKGK